MLKMLLVISYILLLSILSLHVHFIELYINNKLNVSQYNITSSSNYDIPFEYPLYHQCDDNWGSDMMVTKTICQVGCLMSR